IGIDVVDPEVDAVVLATGGRACAGAIEGVDDRTVGVEDDGQRIVGGRGSDVGRLDDDAELAGLLVGHGEICAAEEDVGAADVFVEEALVGEGYAGGGD